MASARNGLLLKGAVLVRRTWALPIIWVPIIDPTSSTASADASASLVPIRKSWMRIIVISLSMSVGERAQKNVTTVRKTALHFQGMIRLRFRINLNKPLSITTRNRPQMLENAHFTRAEL